MNTYEYQRRINHLKVQYLKAKARYEKAQLAEENEERVLKNLKQDRDYYLSELVNCEKAFNQYLKQETTSLETNQPTQTPIYQNWGEFS